MQEDISRKAKLELDRLAQIANQYRDGDISESFFFDVIRREIKKDEDVKILE